MYVYMDGWRKMPCKCSCWHKNRLKRVERPITFISKKSLLLLGVKGHCMMFVYKQQYCIRLGTACGELREHAKAWRELK